MGCSQGWKVLCYLLYWDLCWVKLLWLYRSLYRRKFFSGWLFWDLYGWKFLYSYTEICVGGLYWNLYGWKFFCGYTETCMDESTSVVILRYVWVKAVHSDNIVDKNQGTPPPPPPPPRIAWQSINSHGLNKTSHTLVGLAVALLFRLIQMCCQTKPFFYIMCVWLFKKKIYKCVILTF